MGEKTEEALKLKFDKRLRLEFQGTRITSDAGLLVSRDCMSVYMNNRDFRLLVV